MGHAFSRTRGYNFIEVVVTMLIFNTIVFSIAALWIGHARSVGKARYRMVASFLAERSIEQCLARGFVGVDEEDTRADYPDGVEVVVETTQKGEEIRVVYRSHVTVEDISPDLKSVRVKVTWPEDNTVREIRLETLVSRAG